MIVLVKYSHHLINSDYFIKPSSLWRNETSLRFNKKYPNLCSEDERKS